MERKMDILKLYIIYWLIRLKIRKPLILGWEISSSDPIQVGEYVIVGKDVRMHKFRPINVTN